MFIFKSSWKAFANLGWRKKIYSLTQCSRFCPKIPEIIIRNWLFPLSSSYFLSSFCSNFSPISIPCIPNNLYLALVVFRKLSLVLFWHSAKASRSSLLHHVCIIHYCPYLFASLVFYAISLSPSLSDVLSLSPPPLIPFSLLYVSFSTPNLLLLLPILYLFSPLYFLFFPSVPYFLLSLLKHFGTLSLFVDLFHQSIYLFNIYLSFSILS